MKTKQPLISVIIPVKDLTYYLIFENLPKFAIQTFKNFEVIVLPNQQAQYDLTLLRKYKWLRIIPTGKISRPAEKRNIGVKNAKGEIIAFIDDDAYPKHDWLEQASLQFDKNIAAACGPGLLPANSNFWEKIFNQVISSWIGGGNYTYRFKPEKERYVDDYPSMNFLIRKKLFLLLGGFKGNYWPGEDSKLCEEIVYKLKKRIIYSPKVIVYHHRRNNLKNYLSQHANYGFHRGAFFAHGDKNSRRVAYLIPTFFVLYLLLLLLFTVFSLVINFNSNILLTVTAPFLTYAIFSAQLYFIALFNTGNIIIALFSPFVLFLTHLTYGILFVRGYITGLKHKENIYS